MSVDRRLRLAAEEEASKSGASVSFKPGRSHALMIVELAGQRRQSSLSRTAKRSKEQTDWARQDVRKMVKEIQCNMPKPSTS